ncbi:MAG: hypothetical protein Q9217_004062 [Psora testacea]
MPDKALAASSTTELPLSPPPPAMDVASAMGFTSFGTNPHLAKKRKMGDSDREGGGRDSVPLSPRPDKVASQAQSKPVLQQGSAMPQSLEDRQRREHIENREIEQSDRSKPFDFHAPQQPGHLSGGSNYQAGPSQQGRMPNGEWDWQALRRGVRNERGDTAFYDVSFVEDPWAGLKKEG